MKRLKFLLIIGTCLGLQGCTIAITQTQTEGTASDVVDASQTNDPDPSLNIPVSAI